MLFWFAFQISLDLVHLEYSRIGGKNDSLVYRKIIPYL